MLILSRFSQQLYLENMNVQEILALLSTLYNMVLTTFWCKALNRWHCHSALFVTIAIAQPQEIIHIFFSKISDLLIPEYRLMLLFFLCKSQEIMHGNSKTSDSLSPGYRLFIFRFWCKPRQHMELLCCIFLISQQIYLKK